MLVCLCKRLFRMLTSESRLSILCLFFPMLTRVQRRRMGCSAWRLPGSQHLRPHRILPSTAGHTSVSPPRLCWRRRSYSGSRRPLPTGRPRSLQPTPTLVLWLPSAVALCPSRCWRQARGSQSLPAGRTLEPTAARCQEARASLSVGCRSPSPPDAAKQGFWAWHDSGENAKT